MVPSIPLINSNLLFIPHGEIPNFLSISLVIKRLMRALIRTISATGRRLLKSFTQTLIKLNAKALAISTP